MESVERMLSLVANYLLFRTCQGDMAVGYLFLYHNSFPRGRARTVKHSNFLWQHCKSLVDRA